LHQTQVWFAVARNSINLSKLTIEELVDMQESSEELACYITKVDPKYLARTMEKRMSKAVTRAWKSAASEGLVTGLDALLTKPKFTKTAINDFLVTLGLAVRDPLSKPQKEIIKGRLRSIYRVSKKDAATEVKAKFIFGEPDVRAIAASHNQQLFWVNDFFDANLSKRISAVSTDVLLGQGYSYREAGPVLKDALKQELGLAPTLGPSKFAIDVPARYAGNPDFYFQQVASVSGHQSRIFGKVNGYDEAGITTMQVTNPMDARTSEICRRMFGQKFKVRDGVSQMKNIIDAKTPDEVREQAPWLSIDQLDSALGSMKPGSSSASNVLVNIGMVGPPYHPSCIHGDCLVLTSIGYVPIRHVKVGDLVLTHKGRFRRVSATMHRLYDGHLINFAVQSKISLTTEHPVMEESNDFIGAGKLDSSSRVFALRKEMQDLWKINVGFKKQRICEILFSALSKHSKDRSKQKDARAGYTNSNKNMRMLRKEVSRSRIFNEEKEALFSELQNRTTDCRGGRKRVSGLWENICGAFNESAKDMLKVLQKYSNKNWKSEAGLKRENGGEGKSNVWEESRKENYANCENKEQRHNTGSWTSGSGCYQGLGQAGVVSAIRAETFCTIGKYDILPRFLYSILRSLVRTLCFQKEEEYNKTQVICPNGEKFYSNQQEPDQKFEFINIPPIKIIEVRKLQVYNLEVEEDNTFVVGGVVVHNCRSELVAVL
jgi:hypothetical protein